MRTVTGTGLVISALAATLAALLLPVLTFRGGPGAGITQTVATQFGPLSAADRDFVIRVRLAGLWEIPAGQQAQERGVSPAVRIAGEHLVDGHTALDASVRKAARKLGMELPSQPNAQQQKALDDLTRASGSGYEKKFANILRLAHGKVFALIGQIRATTRNNLVRALADEANTTVLDHITVLEETGLVDFDAIVRDAETASPLPTPSVPPPSPKASRQDVTPAEPPRSARTYPLPPPTQRPERSGKPKPPGKPGPPSKGPKPPEQEKK
ncbi:DUF4142 domain-containing protein [Streptomyces boninensis]|uniref:DUF4142 domain-containing protein n=1 Tax=Streptomyces boninensis TaxID=2039455 RepID=UPI003B220720